MTNAERRLILAQIKELTKNGQHNQAQALYEAKLKIK
jgi:hypothetical protein